MNIAIYSGDDWLSLDKAVLQYQKHFSQILDYSTDNQIEITLLELQNRLQTLGFFEEKRLFVFKNIFLHQVNRGKISEKMEQIMQFFAHISLTLTETDLLFIETDPNKKKYYEKFFPKSTYKSFKLSPHLFYFLDNFFPENLTTCFSYYEKAIKSNAEELVFHMLKRRVKELILILSGNLQGAYAPWQLGKLKSQARHWREEKLVNFYRALYRIEKNLKTGKSPLATGKSLEILLLLTI